MSRSLRTFLSGRRGLGLVALAGALVVAGCGGDDDDDAGPTGPSGSGEAVSAENVAEVQTAVTGAISSAAAKGPGTHAGAVSGEVTVGIAVGKPAQAVSLQLDFDNYSDDGELYLDGDLAYTAGTTVSIVGDLELSGTYDGELVMDLTVSSSGQATGTISVDGVAIDVATGQPAAGEQDSDSGSTDAGDGDSGDGDSGDADSGATDSGDSNDSDAAVTICDPGDAGCLQFTSDGGDAVQSTASVGVAGDAWIISGSTGQMSLTYVPASEGTHECASGTLLAVRAAGLQSAGGGLGSCSVTIVEIGARIRGYFTAQTTNFTGLVNGPYVVGSFDLANPEAPTGLMRATVDGEVFETLRPNVLSSTGGYTAGLPLPSYGVTTGLLVSLIPDQIAVGTFDCGDPAAPNTPSISISPSPVVTSKTAKTPSCQIEITEITDGRIHGTFFANLGASNRDTDIAVTDGVFEIAAP
jgi:hypothetical protein